MKEPVPYYLKYDLATFFKSIMTILGQINDLPFRSRLSGLEKIIYSGFFLDKLISAQAWGAEQMEMKYWENAVGRSNRT